MDSIEDAIESRSGSGGVDYPRVQLIYTVEDGPEGVQGVRVATRLQQMDKRVAPNLGRVDYHEQSSSFILPMTSQVDWDEVEILKKKVDAVMDSEEITVVGVSVGADIDQREL